MEYKIEPLEVSKNIPEADCSKTFMFSDDISSAILIACQEDVTGKIGYSGEESPGCVYPWGRLGIVEQLFHDENIVSHLSLSQDPEIVEKMHRKFRLLLSYVREKNPRFLHSHPPQEPSKAEPNCRSTRRVTHSNNEHQSACRSVSPTPPHEVNPELRKRIKSLRRILLKRQGGSGNSSSSSISSISFLSSNATSDAEHKSNDERSPGARVPSSRRKHTSSISTEPTQLGDKKKVLSHGKKHATTPSSHGSKPPPTSRPHTYPHERKKNQRLDMFSFILLKYAMKLSNKHLSDDTTDFPATVSGNGSMGLNPEERDKEKDWLGNASLHCSCPPILGKGEKKCFFCEVSGKNIFRQTGDVEYINDSVLHELPLLSSVSHLLKILALIESSEVNCHRVTKHHHVKDATLSEGAVERGRGEEEGDRGKEKCGDYLKKNGEGTEKDEKRELEKNGTKPKEIQEKKRRIKDGILTFLSSRKRNVGIFDALIDCTLLCIKAFIRLSKSQETSKAVKTILRSLGHLLGSLTIGRNRSLLASKFDMKKELISSYFEGTLDHIVPMVCRILYLSVDSKVFALPNPWISSIFNVLVEIYFTVGVKGSLRFELESLFLYARIDPVNYPSSNYFSGVEKREEKRAEEKRVEISDVGSKNGALLYQGSEIGEVLGTGVHHGSSAHPGLYMNREGDNPTFPNATFFNKPARINGVVGSATLLGNTLGRSLPALPSRVEGLEEDTYTNTPTRTQGQFQKPYFTDNTHTNTTIAANGNDSVDSSPMGNGGGQGGKSSLPIGPYTPLLSIFDARSSVFPPFNKYGHVKSGVASQHVISKGENPAFVFSDVSSSPYLSSISTSPSAHSLSVPSCVIRCFFFNSLRFVLEVALRVVRTSSPSSSLGHPAFPFPRDSPFPFPNRDITHPSYPREGVSLPHQFINGKPAKGAWKHGLTQISSTSTHSHVQVVVHDTIIACKAPSNLLTIDGYAVDAAKLFQEVNNVNPPLRSNMEMFPISSETFQSITPILLYAACVECISIAGVKVISFLVTCAELLCLRDLMGCGDSGAVITAFANFIGISSVQLGLCIARMRRNQEGSSMVKGEAEANPSSPPPGHYSPAGGHYSPSGHFPAAGNAAGFQANSGGGITPLHISCDWSVSFFLNQRLQNALVTLNGGTVPPAVAKVIAAQVTESLIKANERQINSWIGDIIWSTSMRYVRHSRCLESAIKGRRKGEGKEQEPHLDGVRLGNLGISLSSLLYEYNDFGRKKKGSFQAISDIYHHSGLPAGILEQWLNSSGTGNKREGELCGTTSHFPWPCGIIPKELFDYFLREKDSVSLSFPLPSPCELATCRTMEEKDYVPLGEEYASSVPTTISQIWATPLAVIEKGDVEGEQEDERRTKQHSSPLLTHPTPHVKSPLVTAANNLGLLSNTSNTSSNMNPAHMMKYHMSLSTGSIPSSRPVHGVEENIHPLSHSHLLPLSPPNNMRVINSPTTTPNAPPTPLHPTPLLSPNNNIPYFNSSPSLMLSSPHPKYVYPSISPLRPPTMRTPVELSRLPRIPNAPPPPSENPAPETESVPEISLTWDNVLRSLRQLHQSQLPLLATAVSDVCLSERLVFPLSLEAISNEAILCGPHLLGLLNTICNKAAGRRPVTLLLHKLRHTAGSVQSAIAERGGMFRQAIHEMRRLSDYIASVSSLTGGMNNANNNMNINIARVQLQDSIVSANRFKMMLEQLGEFLAEQAVEVSGQNVLVTEEGEGRREVIETALQQEALFLCNLIVAQQLPDISSFSSGGTSLLHSMNSRSGRSHLVQYVVSVLIPRLPIQREWKKHVRQLTCLCSGLLRYTLIEPAALDFVLTRVLDRSVTVGALIEAIGSNNSANGSGNNGSNSGSPFPAFSVPSGVSLQESVIPGYDDSAPVVLALRVIERLTLFERSAPMTLFPRTHIALKQLLKGKRFLSSLGGGVLASVGPPLGGKLLSLLQLTLDKVTYKKSETKSSPSSILVPALHDLFSRLPSDTNCNINK